jgi:HlyD family secretion protein
MARLAILLAAALLAACSDKSVDQALGTLERDRIVLTATADEIILVEPVPEGTMVSAGTVLVQLDDKRQQARVAVARAQLSGARARLEELRNGARLEEVAAASARVKGANAELTEAQASYRRSKVLRQQNLASQSSLDHARARRDAAEASLDSASEDLLRLTNGTRQEQLDQGAASLQAAEAQLLLEQHLLSELTVVATRDAYLDSLPRHVGERVARGSTLAVLLANGRPYARVYVPEPWRARLHVGDTRKVRVDGVEQALTGRLRWIATDPAFTPYFALNANDRARLVYLAEFDLEEGEQLPTGVPAQVLLGND